jgi:Trk K+ transport system NAD-binding subunit
MDNVAFLIFRRMRAPLIVLIVIYTVGVMGLVLIPGQDAEGNVWHMDFFHAFYFFSYTATTIGFGEIPYAFSDGQRLWVTLGIYLSVVAWFYSIGTLIALLQDKTFQNSLAELRFARRVRRMREPFYLVCGYGETGGALVRAITDGNRHAVVIDQHQERVDLLHLENLREYVPALCGDARRPRHLLEAGLKHPRCAAVVALTDVNETNLKIAIAAKLMHPEVKVICRADSHEVEANMASFGTDYIYDPFDIFGAYLAMAVAAPGLTLLRDWLAGLDGEPLKEPLFPPARGLWILCGYGRFGKAIAANLSARGLELVVVESAPERTGRPEGIPLVLGWGTDARTLKEAGVRQAVGLVVGTHDDANNLSIVMTARGLNPALFIVVRENQRDNEELFQAVGADIVMHPSSIIAERIRVLLVTPLLEDFEQLVQRYDDDWCCQLVSRIVAMVQDQVPEVWEIQIDAEDAHAVQGLMEGGVALALSDLLRDPRERERPLPIIPLLLLRGEEREVLPPAERQLRSGDRLLLCGCAPGRYRLGWTLQNVHALNYVLTGGSPPEGLVWRWLSGRRRGAAALPEA